MFTRSAIQGNIYVKVQIRLNLEEDLNIMLLAVFRYSTTLHDAVCCGRQEIVKILVEGGANVN